MSYGTLLEKFKNDYHLQKRFFMTIKKYVTAFIANTVLFFQTVSPANIIFDLGGVVINTDTIASFYHLGFFTLSYYVLCLKKDPRTVGAHITIRFFQTLERVIQENGITIPDHIVPAYDGQGRQIPYLMQLWLAGKVPNAHICALIVQTIKKHPEWFICKSEQRIMINLTRLTFIPERFAATRVLSQRAIEFIQQCKTYGHKIYVLSNWDAASFAILKEKYADLFALCDGIIISGDVHYLKPDARIYQQLIAQYNLKPQECFFFDDQKENVAAAQQLGINAILFTSAHDFNQGLLPDEKNAEMLA